LHGRSEATHAGACTPKGLRQFPRGEKVLSIHTLSVPRREAAELAKPAAKWDVGMSNVVALLAERREEIRALNKLYDELRSTLGETIAGDVLCEAIRAETEASGAKAAPENPEEAGLEHFAEVFSSREYDGGFDPGNARIEDGKLYLEITRCDYRELYMSSQLPTELANALSCGREKSFAKGYDHRLKLEESSPPNGARSNCRLVFSWNPSARKVEIPRKVSLRVKPS